MSSLPKDEAAIRRQLAREHVQFREPQRFDTSTPGLTEGPILALPAREVLDTHTTLHGRLASPQADTRGFFRMFMTSVYEKAAKEGHDRSPDFPLMFYPLRKAEDSDLLIGILAKQLFTARTFQVTADMTDAVTALYEKMAGTVQHLEAREVPAESGFIWLDKPARFLDVHLRATFVRAISWGPQAIKYPATLFNPDGIGHGVRITVWSRLEDPDDYVDKPEREALADLGDLSMLHTFVIPYHQRMGLSERHSDTPDDLFQWIHCLWVMLDMEITASARGHVDRHTQRRALKSIKHGEVTVITLRRLHTIGEYDGLHGEVDWTCRWIVIGHWRHIDPYTVERHHAADDGNGCCAICDARITWIKPHVKGPDDKPLKAVAGHVYRLSR